MNRRLMLARRDETIAAWNRGDLDGALAHFADDVIVRDIVQRMPLLGREAVRAAIEAYMAAFPDLHVEITSSTAQVPRVANEWTLTGTHLADYMGIAATGRWTKTYGATVTTFDDDGMVIEASMYWNALEMLRQLGVAGTATSAISISNVAVATAARVKRLDEPGGASTFSSSPAAT
jgi:steroid delta-isomerase-like uncharacterized protein